MTNENTVVAETVQPNLEEQETAQQNDKITVLEIKDTNNGWARVAIDSITFNKLRGREPVLPFETVTIKSSNKQYRKFLLDNTTIFSRIETDATGKINNIFVMPEADAKERTIATDETADFSF